MPACAYNQRMKTAVTDKDTKIDYSTQTIRSLDPGESFDILGFYLGEPGDTITVTTTQGDTFNADILDSWNQPIHGGSCSFTYVTFH